MKDVSRLLKNKCQHQRRLIIILYLYLVTIYIFDKIAM